jgi:hypothetical protein
LSFAIIRLGRPYAQGLLERHGWVGFALLAALLFALLPVTAQVVDYGAEGWLWALFGLSQRRYVDNKSAANLSEAGQISKPLNTSRKDLGPMRLVACLIATAVYVWREQLEFSFSQIQYAVFILILSILSVRLCVFLRGTTRFQPPKFIADVLGFIGRHTLEIYAIELAGFQIIARLVKLEF